LQVVFAVVFKFSFSYPFLFLFLFFFFFFSFSFSLIWANGSVGKNKGGDTTTINEEWNFETAGSGKDLGFWLSFGPSEPAAAANAAP
tara:strand:+ start:81 stop:341 length:261 start_codon:yes stop_codon:yes gene_type:complete